MKINASGPLQDLLPELPQRLREKAEAKRVTGATYNIDRQDNFTIVTIIRRTKKGGFALATGVAKRNPGCDDWDEATGVMIAACRAVKRFVQAGAE